MELRQLRYFAVLAEELHFGRAAKRLRIAQPALTQQIKVLEALFGTELFARTKRSVEITGAGSMILEEVHHLLEQADRTRAVAQQAARGEIGRVEIGFVGSATFNGVISKAVSGFRQTRPGVDLQLNEMTVAPLMRALEEGKLDVAFVRPPLLGCPPGIVIDTILKERILIALPADHRLAKKEKLHIRDCADELFIVPSLHPSTGFYAHSEAVWRDAGFHPRVTTKSRQFATICSLVESGMGIALVPESLQHLQLKQVRYRDPSGVTQLSDFAIVYREGEASWAVIAFIDEVYHSLMLPSPDIHRA